MSIPSTLNFQLRRQQECLKITILWGISFMLVTIFGTLARLTQKKASTKKDSWTQFECGFSPINPSHIPFSIQFFLVALLFLIFDVEIALILSYPLEPVSTKGNLLILAFIAFLTLGLLYEWQKGKVEWSKWVGSNSLQEFKSCH